MFKNTASISGLLLATDAIISKVKEDKPEPAGGGGAGMGRMSSGADFFDLKVSKLFSV